MKRMIVENVSLLDLKPDPRNARKHDRENIDAIKASLGRFGQQKPIVVSQDNVIVAGNGTYQAALEMGWLTLAVVRTDLTDWTGFALADNRTADLSRWDDNVLATLLSELTYDPAEIGFDESFTEALEVSLGLGVDAFDEEKMPTLSPTPEASVASGETSISSVTVARPPTDEAERKTEASKDKTLPASASSYTSKIVAPTYVPRKEKPEISKLFDAERAESLLRQIEASSVSEEEKTFLRLAAYRHVSFRFSEIAEYYAHSDIETQDLFEVSALVLIDFDKAVELGFVKTSELLAQLIEIESSVEQDS